jgi:hypothetical protein
VWWEKPSTKAQHAGNFRDLTAKALLILFRGRRQLGTPPGPPEDRPRPPLDEIATRFQ